MMRTSWRHTNERAPAQKRRLRSKLAALAVFCVGVAPLTAGAQTDALPIVIPYEGLLQLGDAPLDGEHSLRFSLSHTDGTTVWGPEEWSAGVDKSCSGAEVTCRVSISNGRFSVALGTHEDLEAAILDAEEVFLEIAILDGAGSWVELSGRQRLTPMPYAMWSAQATDMVVDGDLTVGPGGIEVYGVLDTPSITTSGTVSADTEVHSTGAVSTGSATSNGNFDVTTDIVVDNAFINGDVLRFNSNGSGVGQILYHDSTNDQLDVGVNFSGIQYTNNNTNTVLRLDNTLNFAAQLSVEAADFGANTQWRGDQDPFVVAFVDLGEGTVVDTGVSHDDYICWIGGFYFDSEGDLDVSGNNSTILRAITVDPATWGGALDTGNWYVSMDLSSENSNPMGKEAVVLCADRNLVTHGDGEWFTGFQGP